MGQATAADEKPLLPFSSVDSSPDAAFGEWTPPRASSPSAPAMLPRDRERSDSSSYASSVETSSSCSATYGGTKSSRLRNRSLARLKGTVCSRIFIASVFALAVLLLLLIRQRNRFVLAHAQNLSGWWRTDSGKLVVNDISGTIWPSRDAQKRLLPPRVIVDRPRGRLEEGLIVSRFLGEREDTPLVDSQLHHGLTHLGKDTDKLYEYATDDLGTYLVMLETFIRDHLPTRDSDEDDPDSLINAMRSYFPMRNQRREREPIPYKFFRTGKSMESLMEGERRIWFESFTKLNPGINVTTHDNPSADRWVRERFELTADQRAEGKTSIIEAWNRLGRRPPVLRADFWRYLVLCSEGGYYADQDVHAVRAFKEWGVPQGGAVKRPEGFTEPSLLVGIEADAMDFHNWNQLFARPIQFVQWSMGGSRGHPVLLDTMRRVYEKVMAHDENLGMDILETTGPAPWTSAAFGWFFAQYGLVWPEFHGVPFEGWRYRDPETGEFGDTRVLPLTGLSPNLPRNTHPGSRGVDHPATMAGHFFGASWRGDASPQSWDQRKNRQIRSSKRVKA